jgi:dTDP-4-amino-4,6-dideoxygalactose transaminase
MLTYDIFTEVDLELLEDLLRSGRICGWWNSPNGGTYVKNFEKAFSYYNGSKYAVAVSSGSASIYLALRACGVGNGSRVLVSPYTHVGSVSPIVLAGGVPVFIDVDHWGNIDPDAAEKYCRENDASAMLAVHQNGQPCQMGELKRVCEDYGLSLVEDCSQALGSYYGSSMVGNLGDAGCFSVGGDMTKTISTGEGGVVVTNDRGIEEKCRLMRNHGEKLGAMYPCFNFRISDLQALVGCFQMRSIKDQIKHQKDNANYLIKRLPEFLSFPDPLKGSDPVYYIIACRYNLKNPSRDEFLNMLRNKGFIGGQPRMNVGAGYQKLVYQIPYYSRYLERRAERAERIRESSIWIDWHRYPITTREIDKLLEAMKW